MNKFKEVKQFTESEMSRWNKADLIAHAEELGISSEGTKDEILGNIIARYVVINESTAEQLEPGYKAPEGNGSDNDQNQSNDKPPTDPITPNQPPEGIQSTSTETPPSDEAVNAGTTQVTYTVIDSAITEVIPNPFDRKYGYFPLHKGATVNCGNGRIVGPEGDYSDELVLEYDDAGTLVRRVQLKDDE